MVVDRPERLYLRTPDILETVLPSIKSQNFAYRYRLAAADPEGRSDAPRALPANRQWMRIAPRKPTVVVHAGPDARVQFFAP